MTTPDELGADTPGLNDLIRDGAGNISTNAEVLAQVWDGRWSTTATLTSGADLNNVSVGQLHYIYSGDSPANTPTGAGSGFAWTTSDTANAYVRLQTYYEIGSGRRAWSRSRSGNPGGWTSWERTDPKAALITPTLASSDNLNTIAAGELHYVYGGSAPTNVPTSGMSGVVWTAAPSVNVRLQTFAELGAKRRTWSRFMSAGVWAPWGRTDTPTKTHPVYLTRPLGPQTNESVTARSVRIPFKVPAPALRWRLVFRNANYRGSDTTYPGQVTMRTIVVGDSVADAEGNPTSSFGTGSDAFPDGMRILGRNFNISNLGDEWATEWQSGNELTPGSDYLLAFGYETSGQTVHLGMAGAWWNTIPTNAELRNDPTAANVNRAPFDVRLEMITAADTPTQVVIGDSIAAGSNATFAVREAPANIAMGSAGNASPLPNLHTFGGGFISEWIGSTWGDPNSLKWVDVTRYGRHDRVVLALGSNDLHSDIDLTTLQARFADLIHLARARISPNIIACTITPRTAWTGLTESRRTMFNDWLRGIPEGLVAVADTARAVEDPTTPANPRADFVASDGIHFNSAGCAALASAIAQPQPIPTQPPSLDTGWRNVTALSGVVTSGSIRLRRIGPIVYWRIESVVTSDGDTINNLPNQIPSGFRDLNLQRYALAVPAGRSVARTAGAELRLETPGGSAGATFEGQFSYPTDEPWPATLPGTPA